jgi:tetratricopeptide (TPR) repeat protein
MDRGVLRYNSTVRSDAYKAAGADKTALLEPPKKDWKDAAEVSSAAVANFKAQTPPTDPSDLANFNKGKYFALRVRSEALNKVVVKVDPTQVDAGVAAYEEYLASESDATQKTKVERDMGKMLFDANSYEKAKPVYEKILAQNPDDADALQNMGLILYNLGFMKEADGKKDEAKGSYQEAANYLQRFVEKTTDAQLKGEAQAVLQNLKEQQNVQAEKVSTPTRKRRP